MVTLLETKIDIHLPLLNPFGFSDMIEIPTEGQAGGMVILWDHTKVNVHSFVRRSHEISATIEVFSLHKTWVFTSIYASTDRTLRNLMWNNIVDMHSVIKGPWLLGGDFNDVLASNEKLGGRSFNKKITKILWDCINSCNLINLGFKGSKFTWSNNRKKNKGIIMKRLDRNFANEDWISLFPEASVTHLPRTHSDHNPLLIEVTPKKRASQGKPFRLETFWCRHPNFINLVKDRWLNSNYVQDSNNFLDNIKN